MSDQMILVFRVSLVILDGEWISIHVKHLQILKFGLFVSSSPKIGDDLFETLNLVVTDWENIEFAALVEPCEDHDFVIVKRKVSQVYQVVKALDVFNVVER